jgi:hypothetical protein
METATSIPPAVLGFFLVHTALRREAAGVIDDAAAFDPDNGIAAKALARRIVLLERVVHVHDRGEDDLLWPLLARHTSFDAEAVTLIDEHVALDDALAALHSTAVKVARRPSSVGGMSIAAQARVVAGLLVTHLDHEEAAVVPTWVACVPEADQERHRRQLSRATPVSSARRALCRLWWEPRFARRYWSTRQGPVSTVLAPTSSRTAPSSFAVSA